MKIPKWLSTTLSFVLVALLFVAYFFTHTPTKEVAPAISYQFPTTSSPEFSHPLTIGESHILVAYAKTETELQQGLSNTAPLRFDQGMLFIFPSPRQDAFWMKDMNYPLDIIWLDADKKVTDIEPNLSPTSYPKSFGPDAPASYVLEVSAGFAAKNTIVVGTQIKF